MNTSALKSFAPAVRTQLMEAVGASSTTSLLPIRRTSARLPRRWHPSAGRRERTAPPSSSASLTLGLTASPRCAFWMPKAGTRSRPACSTPATPEETQPEILKLLRTGSLPAELHPHTDLQRLNDLLDGRLPTAIAGADPQGEAYRGLILAACRLYHTLLPDVFDKLNDESELLLPDDLLTATSVAEGFRTEITDSDCLEADASGKSRANVEILGWLYQFYISEKKDAVMARKSAVPTEGHSRRHPALHPALDRPLPASKTPSAASGCSIAPALGSRDHMPCYIEGRTETDFLKITNPEEIRLCDPAVGSGHMLTYAFDLLTLIYEEEGYTPSEIPALILRHNLHGLEICPRAAQLAELALIFKAREKSRRFFQPEHLVRPNITELRDVRYAENELSDYTRALKLGNIFQHTILTLLHQFEEAKNFGSLIQPCIPEPAILEVRRIVTEYWSLNTDQSPSLFLRETHLKVLRVLDQAEALTQRYHVVVANPPYMGRGGMNVTLRDFVDELFPNSKHNLFSVFMERLGMLAMKSGAVAMVTMQNWMFLSRFSAFRTALQTWHLDSLLHLGARAFDSISGEVVQTAAFTFCTTARQKRPTHFFRLVDGDDSDSKERAFLSAVKNPACSSRFAVATERFRVIQEEPLCYWATDRELVLFEKYPVLGKQLAAREGMATGSNGLFLRLWHEVALNRAAFGCATIPESVQSRRKWFPYNKGGGELRWFGNNDYFVNWQNDGAEIRSFADEKTGRIRSHNYNGEYSFREGVSWSSIGSGRLSARYSPVGFLFDAKGTTAFAASKLLFLPAC